MLSTILQIGNTFKKSPNGLVHHRYVKRAPQREPDNKKAVGNTTQFFRVPVNADGSFDFNAPEEFNDENLIEKLFYLNYKTSDADTYKKYLFGDIYKLRLEQGKNIMEDGNFRFGDAGKKGLYALNSFDRAKADAESLDNERIKNFRHSFERDMERIETFLSEHPNVYLHFDFQGKHWYQLPDVMDVINKKLMSEFIREIEKADEGAQGYVLQKALYKTLACTSEGASGRVPRFTSENDYKNKLFAEVSDVMDLLYAVDFSTKSVIRKGDVKIIILPRGKGLSAEQIERFFTRQNIETAAPAKKAQQVRDAVDQEQVGVADSMEELFAAPLEGTPENIAQFDFVFSKAGSASAPDIDMIEVAGLERGLLECLSERVVEIRRDVEINRPKSDKIRPLSITQSFLNILGDSTKAKKKYQNHLFKVLPQIYTGTYYHDDVLLPALIEKTEFNIRNEQANFGLMKFDFYFLTKLLNCKENRLMEIQDSSSYQVGTLLGQLARQFAGPKSPIKSFEKNYVGLLSRRITTLPEVVRLSNEINQKLVMHELGHFTFRISHNLAEAIKDFQGTYNKDECAFGFFESYFTPVSPKKEGAGDGNDHAASVPESDV